MNNIKKIPIIRAIKQVNAFLPLKYSKIYQVQTYRILNTNSRPLFSPLTNFHFSSKKDLENIDTNESDNKKQVSAEEADIAESKRLDKYTNKIILFSLGMMFLLVVVQQPDEDEEKPKKTPTEAPKKPEPIQEVFEVPEVQSFKMNESALNVHNTLQKTSFNTVQEKIDDPYSQTLQPYDAGLAKEIWKGTVQKTSNVIDKVAGVISEIEKVNEKKKDGIDQKKP